MDKQVEGKKFPQYLAALLATLGALSAGSYLSWTSAAIPLYQNNSTSLYLTKEQGSWAGSFVPLGALFGALPAGILADKLGRKIAVILVTIPLLASWLLIGYVSSVLWLYLGRFLAGIAVGATSVTVPMYVSEIAEPSIRGSLGTFFQLLLTVGVFFEYLTGILGDLQYIALVSAIVPAVLLVSFPFMPESPAWLASQGRRAEAESALRRLRGDRYQPQQEMDQLERNHESQNDKVGLLELRKHDKSMVIALGLMVFQQLSGVNAVIFYAAQIFKDAGSDLSSTWSSIIIGVVQVVATYSSTLLVDRAGRKILLLVSSSVMALCLFTLAVYFKLQENEVDLHVVSWIPLIALAVFIVVFSLGFGPIPWMIVGELFPSNVKGHASSVSAACNWTLAFVVTKVFQNMVDSMGTGLAFGLFGLVCGGGTAFVATMVPETKGKTVEEVQTVLYGVREGDAIKFGKSRA